MIRQTIRTASESPQAQSDGGSNRALLEHELRGPDGTALLLVRIRLASDQLSSLLATLAQLSFPVNPEISGPAPTLEVEFPAYQSSLVELESALNPNAWPGLSLTAFPMMQALRQS